MIAYLRGNIKYKSAIPKKDNFIILDVNGVGYRVSVLDSLINKVQTGQELEVFTFTQVAETALDLYGFSTQEELTFFNILLSISGVGPKTAQKIVAGLQNKIGGLNITGDGTVADSAMGEALEALIGLGYSASQARDALSHAKSEDIGDKIKEALKILGKK
jgi:Holliday junction DNA helicase RuvA